MTADALTPHEWTEIGHRERQCQTKGEMIDLDLTLNCKRDDNLMKQ
jgi:hypothetical protein